MIHRVLRRRIGPAYVALVAAAFVSLFIAMRSATHTGGVAAFVIAGDRYVDPQVRAELPVRHNSPGYDGQFVYRLARDPFTHQVTASGITLDNPPYRQQRIALPVIGWLVDRVPGVSLAWALVLVNAVAIAACAWFGARLAQSFGRSPLWGIVVAIAPALAIALARDLTEPLATAGLLAGLDAWRRSRYVIATVVFTAAALARETVLIVLAGIGAWLLFAAVRRLLDLRVAITRVSVVVVPALAVLGWQLYLRERWGRLPSAANAQHPTPFVAPARHFFDGLSLSGVNRTIVLHDAWVVERVLLVALLALIAFAIVRERRRLPMELVFGWCIAAFVTVSVRWEADVQFARVANEAVIVGLLLLFASRRAPGRWGLAISGAWSAIVVALYAGSL